MQTSNLSPEQKLLLFEVASGLAKVGYWSLDLESEHVWWSDEIYRIHGYEPGEIVPDLTIGVRSYHPDDQPKVEEALAASQASGKPFDFSLRIIRPTGEIRYVQSHGICEYGSDGTVKSMFGIFLDVTEAQLASRVIQEDRMRLEMAAQAGGFGVWDLDLEEGTLIWDEHMYEMYDVPPGTTVSYDMWEGAVCDEDKERAAADVARAIETTGKLDTNFRVVHRDGSMHYLIANATVIADEDTGKGRRMIGINYDLTHWHEAQDTMRRAKEREEVANKMKSEFLAKMSHEIRTPMNGLLGMLDQISEANLSPDQADKLHLARQSGRNLLNILTDTLDFTKIEAGQARLEKIAFRPHTLLSEVLGLFEPSAEAKGLTCSLTLTPDMTDGVLADMGKIRQIILNLVGNAVKFTNAGSVSLSGECTTTDTGDIRLIITVADTGVGIPAHAHNTLFEKFTQADNSVSRRFGGTGLGLSISKGFADLMGAELSFESQENAGTTFTLKIPVEPADEKDLQVTEPSFSEAQGLFEGQNTRLLVAEDHPINKRVMEGHLARFGLTANYAATGKEAVERAAEDKYDLILMDIHMPEMDGITATRQIRSENGPNQATPIVAVTADALAESRLLYEEAGMEGMLEKPITLPNLSSTLCKHLPVNEAQTLKSDTANTATQSDNSNALGDLLADL